MILNNYIDKCFIFISIGVASLVKYVSQSEAVYLNRNTDETL